MDFPGALRSAKTNPTLDVGRALTTPEEPSSSWFTCLSNPELGLNPLGHSHGHCLVRPSRGALQVRHLPVFSSEVSPPASAALSLLLSSLQWGLFSLVIFHLHVNSFVPGNPRDILHLSIVSVPLST